MITLGKIIATNLVKVELEKQRDELFKFVNKFPKLFVQPTYEEQEIVKEIINNKNFSKWAIGQRHKADPFVIALAKAFNLTVVTYEKPDRARSIPAACKEFNVQCIDFIGFLRGENFQI